MPSRCLIADRRAALCIAAPQQNSLAIWHCCKGCSAPNACAVEVLFMHPSRQGWLHLRRDDGKAAVSPVHLRYVGSVLLTFGRQQ
mmetsp:Transcript_54186/g.137667  ORF Transcript_54186/g.137667 Transcript_54186/m.137667 type:complete len:85 (+) Transcript_54186:780-1034(+)